MNTFVAISVVRAGLRPRWPVLISYTHGSIADLLKYVDADGIFSAVSFLSVLEVRDFSTKIPIIETIDLPFEIGVHGSAEFCRRQISVSSTNNFSGEISSLLDLAETRTSGIIESIARCTEPGRLQLFSGWQSGEDRRTPAGSRVDHPRLPTGHHQCFSEGRGADWDRTCEQSTCA